MTHETAAKNIMSQLSPTPKTRRQKNSRVNINAWTILLGPWKTISRLVS